MDAHLLRERSTRHPVDERGQLADLEFLLKHHVLACRRIGQQLHLQPPAFEIEPGDLIDPLTSIKTFAEFLPERYQDAEFRKKFAKVMSQEVDKMNELVHRLLDFAKPHPPQLQSVRISALIGETVQFLQGTLLKAHVHVETSLAEHDGVLVDPSQMRQVFLNILLNSIEAMPAGGKIRLSSSQQNGHVDITFSDTGPGMPPSAISRAFDPFYTTKPEGTGLGLSVVHSIVREHGGGVVIASQLGKGTEVKISLPIKGGTNGATAHSDRG